MLHGLKALGFSPHRVIARKQIGRNVFAGWIRRERSRNAPRLTSETVHRRTRHDTAGLIGDGAQKMRPRFACEWIGREADTNQAATARTRIARWERVLLRDTGLHANPPAKLME